MTNEEISNDTYSSETPQNELLKFVKEKLNVIKENRVFVYIIRRFMVLIPLWFGTAVLTFAMVRAMGSPADLYIGTSSLKTNHLLRELKPWKVKKSKNLAPRETGGLFLCPTKNPEFSGF